MFTKIKNKMNNMSTKDWIVFSLWLATFALLIAFVIAAAVMTKSTDTLTTNKADTAYLVEASTKPTDTDYLIGRDVTTGTDIYATGFTEVTSSDILTGYIYGKGEAIEKGMKLFQGSVAEYKSVVTHGVASYVNTLAALGLVFGASLFIALITTVAFAYKKRKGGE